MYHIYRQICSNYRKHYHNQIDRRPVCMRDKDDKYQTIHTIGKALQYIHDVMDEDR